MTNEVGWGIVPTNDLARGLPRYARPGERGVRRPGRGRWLVVAGRAIGLLCHSRRPVARSLAALLADLPEPDAEARAAVGQRAATVLRPTGALARLDEVAVWLAGWQRTANRP